MKNVLVFIMDDQTPGTIGALGNPYISTPNLDKLVETGSFFRPYTTVPVCTPGRAEFLTGKNAFKNGCRWFNEPINSDITLLPQALREAGYYCFHAGKWHNDGHPRDKGYHETTRVFPSDLVKPYSGQTFTYKDGEETIEGHSTEVIMDAAIEFIERAPSEQPWFCYVALHSAHDPRVAPEPWMSMYDNQMPPLPDNYMPEHPFDNGDMLIRDERLAGFPRRPAEIRRHLADYYSMISHHDHYIGRALRALDLNGQRDNTLVVFTSDHGLACGSHGLMGKENLYEHSARVPLILQGQGIPEGKRFDNSCLCGHYDFLPTLMDYLGLQTPDSAQGISYADVLDGKVETVRKTIGAGYRDCMRMVRDGRYKLIYYPHIEKKQLFDLEVDPEETNDLLTSWRRDAEGRVCPPPLSPQCREYEPDPAAGSGYNPDNNPLYQPALPREEVERIVELLSANLMDWQAEVGDPLL